MKTLATHTRGPWQCSTSPSGLLVSQTTGEVVARFEVAPTTDDAKLIAAAPDLLDVLKTLTFICESLAHLRGMERELLPHTDHARMIIDSIEG